MEESLLSARRRILGHYVDRNGVSVLRDRVRQIEDWLRLANVREIRAFLGFCGYYRRFVRNYSTVAAPLVLLTRKTVKWKWGKDQDIAFNDLKDVLCSAPVLAPLDYSKPWIIDCDASDNALGAILSQAGGYGIEHPMYYYSRTFNTAESNYSTTDRECLAVVAGMKKFRVYVLGGEILIRTDHSAVRQLLNNAENTGRYARWVLVLSEFDFTLKYRPGGKHGNADGLSRMTPAVRENLEDIDDEPWHYALRAELRDDPWYEDIIRFLETANALGGTRKERRRVRQMARRYTFKNGQLYYRDLDGELKVCVVSTDVPAILREFHDSAFGGHWGRDITLANIRRSKYWPIMRRDVEEHVRKCDACQRWKPGPHLSGISPTFVTESFELLLIDWLVELPVTTNGKSCMITCTDALTKWTETRSTARATALESARFFMEQIFMKFGAPLAVATDNGQHFKGEFDELLEKLHVAHHWGSPYHPQSTGQAEKTNGLITARIRRWLPEEESELGPIRSSSNASCKFSTE